MERGKNVEKEGLVQWLPSQVTRKREGEHRVLRAQVIVVQVERVCPLCQV